MSEYRAPRVWHFEKQFDRWYVKNQWGGFAGWHESLDGAREQLGKYLAEYPEDRFEP